MMLIVGGSAVFCNLKRLWIGLVIVELINVALFLVLFVMVVVVLMMATGTTDPVRRATDATWEQTILTLTSTGTDPNGDGIYCQVYGGADCTTWYGTGGAVNTEDDCPLNEGGSNLDTQQALNNCTRVNEIEDCQGDIYNKCVACDLGCKEALIQDIKDQILPASYFVFVLCFFLLVAIVWNNVMIGMDEVEGIPKIIGLVINGVVVLFSFVLIVMAGWGINNADSTCPETVTAAGRSCIPDSMIILLIVGLGLLGTGAFILAGIQLDNNLLLRIGTLVMVFLSLICLLTGLVMGMSSGAVMDDMQYYYDSNYPKMRAALERVDNSYCKLKKADCTTAATGAATAASPVFAYICDDPDAGTGCEQVENSGMTSAALWSQMWSAASLEAAKGVAGDRAWLENCQSSGVCIDCDEFYVNARDGNLDNPGSPVEDGELAFNFKKAVVQETMFDGTDWTADALDDDGILKCSDSTTTIKDTSTSACPAADSTYPGSAADQAACDAETEQAECEAVANCVWKSDACVLADGPMSVDDWSAALTNYTSYTSSTLRGKKAECEMAILAYTAQDTNCPPENEVPAAQAGSYKADCALCKTTPDFTFDHSTSEGGCLNWFVGHYEDACAAVEGGNLCKAELYGSLATTKTRAQQS